MVSANRFPLRYPLWTLVLVGLVPVVLLPSVIGVALLDVRWYHVAIELAVAGVVGGIAIALCQKHVARPILEAAETIGSTTDAELEHRLPPARVREIN